jgi:hypothetical protein
LEVKQTGLLVALAAALVMTIACQAIDTGLAQAFAQTESSTADSDNTATLLTSMLNSSEGVARAKMADLQAMAIPVPPDVTDLYSLAVAEKTSALDSLERSDIESAKTHTLKAMQLFKQVTELTNEASSSEALLPTLSDTDIINQRLLEVRNAATHIRTVVMANNLAPVTNGDFARFDSAITLATLAIIQGNLAEAEKQLSISEALLDSIQGKMHSGVHETSYSERAMKFAQDAATRLEELIIKAEEMGLSDAELDAMKNEWQSILSQLENANDIDYIIQLADQLIGKERAVKVLVGELVDETPDEEPATDESGSDGPVDDEAVDDDTIHDQLGDVDDELARLENDIASLKSQAEQVDLPFPTSDVEEMLSSIEQHAENGEDQLAAQDIEELDDFLDTIGDVIQGYSDSKAEIATAAETAESLKSEVIELNYLQFLPGIEDALALLIDAEAELGNLSQEGSLSYSSIGSAFDYIDLADGLVATANSALDESRASFDAFLVVVEETTNMIEEAELRADEIEDDIPDTDDPSVSDILEELEEARALLDSAREALGASDIDQSLEDISEASVHLDEAESLLEALLESLLDLAGGLL